MTIAQTAIAEIKRRMQLTAPKPKIKTEYMIAEQTEDADFRQKWKEVKDDIEKLARLKRSNN